MTVERPSRSVTIDAELIRGMTWDATVYTVTRPLAVLAYAALIAAFVVNAIVLGMVAADESRAMTLTLTMFAIAALIVGSVAFTRASARRAILAVMPSGSTVRAEVGDESITLASKRGVSDMRYSTFRGVRVGRHAAILQLRSASVVTAVPRVLLSDADVALLKSRI